MTTYVRDLKHQIWSQEQQLSEMQLGKNEPEPPKYLKLNLTDRLSQALDNNDKFKEKFKPPKVKSEEAKKFDVKKVNKYLGKNKFSFYGSTIALHAEDKIQALENELVRDYHVRLEEAEAEKHAALEEHKVIKMYFNQLKELSDYR